MSLQKLTRITLHWTAGTNLPNAVDRSHYHFMVDGNGMVQTGKFKPEDNINCNDNKYAQHTGGGNTGSIGVALCGMLGYKNPAQVGDFPITKEQCEAAFKFIAGLCRKYNIPVTPQTVMTHYEFGKAHPTSSSSGKIDITYLPAFPEVKASEIGEFIRNKVNWYIQKGDK